MKKILTALAILAFFSISFNACKKEKTKTVAEKIIGTWQIDNIVYNVHTEGIDHIITNNDFTAADTYEFRKDGTVYATVGGHSESSAYSISGENKVTITASETFDIKTLDGHTLVLYYKQADDSLYHEMTITFKR